jgi:hypothetical protein
MEKKMSKEQLSGQRLSDDKVAKLQQTISARSENEHLLEAAQATEDTLTWLRATWGNRGFTREQAVFSIALATINLRETFPEGKDAFDAIAGEARKYYDLHKGE